MTSPSHGWKSAWWVLLAWLLIALITGTASAQSTPSPLEEIRARGAVRIGVKTDFPPFGMLDAQGTPIGFEVDLAERIAQSLGVTLTVVPVTTENRFQRLEQQLVDVIIATAGDTRERRQLATAIEPNYYGAGVTVMLRPEAIETEWSQIRAQPLCALQGAYFNKPITQRHIVELQLYRSVRDALLALKDGGCIGYLYTDVAIDHLLKQPEWSGYKAPMPSSFVIPWAISIARKAKGSDLERALGGLVASWHRDGTLIAMERQWNIRPSRFLADSQALWLKRDEAGRPLCERQPDGEWPLACRNQTFVTSAEASGVSGFGLWLKEQAGVDLSILHDGYDLQRYLRGIGYTIALTALSLVLAVVLGCLGARVALARHAVWRVLARGMAMAGRSTPPLLLMYLLMFGLGSHLVATTGVRLSPLLVGILAIGIYHGAMIVFNLVEAAELLRKNDERFEPTLRHLPQMIAVATVGLRTSLTNLSKASSMASAIAVPELLSATLAIIADQGNQTTMMNVLLVVAYVFTALWIALFARLERRARTWAER